MSKIIKIKKNNLILTTRIKVYKCVCFSKIYRTHLKTKILNKFVIAITIFNKIKLNHSKMNIRLNLVKA